MQRANDDPEMVERGSASTCARASRVSPLIPASLEASFLQQEEGLLSFQSWLDILPDAMVIVNTTGLIILINSQAETLFGYTREELVGKPLEVLLPERLHLAHVRHRQQYAALPHIRPMGAGLELYGRRKDGSEVPVDISLGPLHLGGAFYALAAIRDITERKLLEQHRQLDQRKDEFISMASHELKTPLTSLTAYVDLLRRLLEQETNTKTTHYLARIDVQLTKLTRLISDLLDISRVQAGKLVYAEEPVMVGEMVREEVEQFQPTAPKHHIIVTGEAACQVIGDRNRLGQVVINLLNNAIKYSPQAERVIVRLESSASEVIVSVQDFGIGIPVSHQGRIFERFYRAAINQNHLFPGLGIGLYISYQIIQHHGGRIWVDSVEGQGSTFSFALPLNQA